MGHFRNASLQSNILSSVHGDICIRIVPMKVCLPFLLSLLPIITTAFHVRLSTSYRADITTTTGLGMSTTTTTVLNGSAPTFLSTMKKMSKVLSVGIEYSGKGLSNTEISILSMQLRKCKVSAIFTPEMEALKEFANEQKSSLGNFPGPCLVIFNGPPSMTKDAIEAGASGVVLSANCIDDGSLLSSLEGETIWKVESQEDVQSVLDKTNGSANVFLVDVHGEDVPSSIVESIPTKALWIAAIDAMQAEGNEITIAKNCKTRLGCGSVLIKDACVGDAEDMEYTQFCVGGVTSKASSEFKFSGLTGSTNGHFGGIQSNSSVKWRRPTISLK